MIYILAGLTVAVTFLPEYSVYLFPTMIAIMTPVTGVFYYLTFMLFTGLNTSSLNVESHGLDNWQTNITFMIATVVIYFQYSPFLAGIFVPMAVIAFINNIFAELVKHGIVEINDVDE